MDDLKSSGVIPILMDVTSTEDCNRAMKEIEAVSGQIDLLICNAGELSCENRQAITFEKLAARVSLPRVQVLGQI